MKSIWLILLAVFLCGAASIAQSNPDKASGFLSSQQVDYESFEATYDALRNVNVPAQKTLTVTIGSSQSLSDSIDLGDWRLVAIESDGSWTTANMTFLTWNSTGLSWSNLIADDGTELSYSFTDSTTTIAKPTHFAGIRYLKVRSGTSGTPVAQVSARSIGLIVRRY